MDSAAEGYPSLKKPIRELNPDYVRFIHEWACCIPLCRTYPVHAHHTKTKGSGGSDMSCIPLCYNHHMIVHNVGTKTFESRYKLCFKDLVNLYNERFKTGINGPYKSSLIDNVYKGT